MNFPCSIKKMTQAVAVLLRNEPDYKTDFLRTLKMLYIADREAITETGTPILGTLAVAMENGPLHSQVYDLMKGTHIDEQQWAKFFHTVGYMLELVEDPGVSELSRYQVEKLQEVSNRYAHLNGHELSMITHHFPEWKETFEDESDSSFPIPIEKIIESIGREDQKEEILSNMRAQQAAEAQFGASQL